MVAVSDELPVGKHQFISLSPGVPYQPVVNAQKLVFDNWPMAPDMKLALYSIVGERIRQNIKWGEQNHRGAKWHLILSEEVGEFAQSVLDNHDLAKVREEAVQVAAVALAIVECIDRNGENFKEI